MNENYYCIGEIPINHIENFKFLLEFHNEEDIIDKLKLKSKQFDDCFISIYLSKDLSEFQKGFICGLIAIFDAPMIGAIEFAEHIAERKKFGET